MKKTPNNQINEQPFIAKKKNYNLLLIAAPADIDGRARNFCLEGKLNLTFCKS